MFLTMFSVSPPIETIFFCRIGKKKQELESGLVKYETYFEQFRKVSFTCDPWCVCSVREKGQEAAVQLERIRDKDRESILCFIHGGRVVGDREHDLFSLNDGHLVERCKFYCFFRLCNSYSL